MRLQPARPITRIFALLAFAAVHVHAQQPAAGASAPASPPAEQTNATDIAVSPDHEAGESLVRIVRLSQITGTVQMDRETGNGFEPTSPNMPVVQGARLRTGDGLAEVEFEDNSSLRLTPGTEVDFPQLKLRATGEKVSVIEVERGSVYLSMAGTSASGTTVQFAGHTLTLSPSAHVHLFVGPPSTRLTVLAGTVRVTGPDGTAVAEKKQTLTFNPTGVTPPQLAKGIIHNDYDEWDKNETNYQKRYALASSSFGGAPSGYGLADLNYYGSFTNAGGCGQMWQPYLISAGWSPYSAGLWAWYPGAGYSYVSMYPWGWLPFHSGEWAFCQGTGWGWRPTGGWNGLGNLRKLHVTGPTGVKPPTPPPPPGPRQSTLTLAKGNGPLPLSGLQPSGDFRFNRNSAGLGVPRGAFSHLSSISANVQQHGTVTTVSTFHAMDAAVPRGTSPSGSSVNAVSRAYAGSSSGAMAANSIHASAPAAPASTASGGSHK